MRKVLIMHQTITKHDAIGNDIECMYQLLNKNSDCKCFAENKFNGNLQYATEQEAHDIIADKEGIVLYHHSVNWPLGEKLIQNCKATLIFRYHNITPPEFFAPYNVDYRNSCDQGRKQTERLIEAFPHALWMADSPFNVLDLGKADQSKIDICAPFHKIESWSNTLPDEGVLQKLIFDKRHKVLFVGRVAPNKGHSMLFDIMDAYCRNFDSNIKLYVIGKFDEGLAPYNQLIKDKIRRYQLEDKVEFVGEINDAILMAYYLGCDVFLCTSDHEGFCVPIIEAQKFQLPIIAKDSCAVPDTIGKNQILLNEDVNEYAAAIRLLTTKKDMRDYLRENGSINFEQRFSYKTIETTFKKIMLERTGLQL